MGKKLPQLCSWMRKCSSTPYPIPTASSEFLWVFIFKKPFLATALWFRKNVLVSPEQSMLHKHWFPQTAVNCLHQLYVISPRGMLTFNGDSAFLTKSIYLELWHVNCSWKNFSILVVCKDSAPVPLLGWGERQSELATWHLQQRQLPFGQSGLDLASWPPGGKDVLARLHRYD